jgi:hypothetical protein
MKSLLGTLGGMALVDGVGMDEVGSEVVMDKSFGSLWSDLQDL